MALPASDACAGKPGTSRALIAFRVHAVGGTFQTCRIIAAEFAFVLHLRAFATFAWPARRELSGLHTSCAHALHILRQPPGDGRLWQLRPMPGKPSPMRCEKLLPAPRKTRPGMARATAARARESQARHGESNCGSCPEKPGPVRREQPWPESASGHAVETVLRRPSP